MDSYEILLTKIREKPGLYLGEKSLKALSLFLHGYSFRENVEAWEEWTNLSFFENFDVATRSSVPKKPDHFYSTLEFTSFVCSHYNREVAAFSGEQLISEMCNSEEEAFDKYFELRDTFKKQKESRSNERNSPESSPRPHDM